MAVKEGKSRIMISLSDELKSKIEENANEAKRSMSAEIEVALEIHYRNIIRQRNEVIEKMNDMQSMILSLTSNIQFLSSSLPKYNDDDISTFDTITPNNQILHYVLTSIEDKDGNKITAEEYFKSKNKDFIMPDLSKYEDKLFPKD